VITANKVKRLVVVAISLVVVLVALGIFSQPTKASHAGDPKDLHGCATDVLGIPVWYKYLKIERDSVTDACEVVAPDGLLADNIPWLIAAAVLEILLRIATYVVVIMVFWGGYQILASSGTPEAVAGGRDKIMNGIIGLIIAIMAISVVSYISSELAASGGAVVFNDPVTGQQVELLPNENPTSLIEFALRMAYRIAAGLTVIFVAISGFNFITSGGDPQRVAKARNSIIYAIIGLVITLLAVAIITAVGDRL